MARRKSKRNSGFGGGSSLCIEDPHHGHPLELDAPGSLEEMSKENDKLLKNMTFDN